MKRLMGSICNLLEFFFVLIYISLRETVRRERSARSSFVISMWCCMLIILLLLFWVLSLNIFWLKMWCVWLIDDCYCWIRGCATDFLWAIWNVRDFLEIVLGDWLIWMFFCFCLSLCWWFYCCFYCCFWIIVVLKLWWCLRRSGCIIRRTLTRRRIFSVWVWVWINLFLLCVWCNLIYNCECY